MVVKRKNIYGYWQYDDKIPLGEDTPHCIEKNDILYVIAKKGDRVQALHKGNRIALDVAHIEKACSRPRRGHAPVWCNEKTKEETSYGRCDKCRVYLKKKQCINGDK